MSTEEIKALVRRLVEEYNKGEANFLTILDEGYATDVVVHSSAGQDVHGLKEYKQSIKEFFSRFPDLHITIDDMIVEGDKVAVRWTVTYTRLWTNKKATMWAITIYRIVEGKVMEEWSRLDTMAMMQQLGM